MSILLGHFFQMRWGLSCTGPVRYWQAFIFGARQHVVLWISFSGPFCRRAFDTHLCPAPSWFYTSAGPVYTQDYDLYLGQAHRWCNSPDWAILSEEILKYLCTNQLGDVTLFSGLGSAHKGHCDISLVPSARWCDSPLLPGPHPHFEFWHIPGSIT